MIQRIAIFDDGKTLWWRRAHEQTHKIFDRTARPIVEHFLQGHIVVTVDVNTQKEDGALCCELVSNEKEGVFYRTEPSEIGRAEFWLCKEELIKTFKRAPKRLYLRRV